MIRPFTCLTVLLAAGSGLYLYTEKHRTTILDERIRTVVQDTNRIEDRTSMLRAEWALLNQPDRLQTLAAKFLPKLQPMAPTQFVQAADLDSHLPPVGPPPGPLVGTPGGAIAPVPPGAGVAAPASVPQTPPVIMASAGTTAPRPKPVQPAAGAKPVAPVRLASAVVSHPPVVRVAAHVRRPDDLRSMVAAAWAAREAASPARGSAVNLVRPVVSYSRPAPVYAGAWRAAPAPATSYAGSALGMAHEAMAPPMAAR